MGLKFYGERAVQSRTIKFGSEQGELVAVAAMISKLFIVCVYLVEYMFASLFGAALQTVIIRFSPSFGALISSFNGDIWGIIGGVKWIYTYSRICFILKGLFSAYFIMVYGFVAGIFNGIFGGLTKYTLASAIGAFTKDYNCPSRRVVAAIRTRVGGYFWPTLSATVVVTINSGNFYDNINEYYQISYFYHCYFYYQLSYSAPARTFAGTTGSTHEPRIVFNQNSIGKAGINIVDSIFGIGLCENKNEYQIYNRMVCLKKMFRV